MKTKDLINKDNKTLDKILADTQAKIVKDRFKIASREMTIVSEIKKSRKTVAQIKTILSERELVEREKTLNKEKTGDKK